MAFIDWSTLNFKKHSGIEKLRCPECDAVRSDKKDKSLVVYHKDGLAKCFYCNALSFKEKTKTYSEKTYTVPAQTWKNYTNLSEKLVKWVETERKIRQSVLIDLGVTEEKYYQPKQGKEVNNIVFNYFEGDKLVNKKYRSANKEFTQTQGGKPIMYNINSAIGAKELYIVEGEFDVLALITHGIKEVVSVPNGANDNDEYWKNSEPYLNTVEKFIIATDNDQKGIELREKIAQRLGRFRCEFIEWSEKDANGSLIKHSIDYDLSKRKRFPVSGTWRIEDLRDGIFDLYNNGLPETISPKHRCFGNLKDKFSIMMGQLTVCTGIPSHGKSNFSEWYALNIINDFDLKCSLFSPEHSPMSLHQTTLMQKAIGRNFWKDFPGRPRIQPLDVERYIKWANEKIYITLPDNGHDATWDWLFEKAKEQIFTFGINVFIFDAWNKIRLPKGNKLEEIGEVLNRLTSFCQINNVACILVAHPTKMKKDESGEYDIPTLYDVAHSADFRNQTHNGFAIHRYFQNENQNGYTKFVNLKTKYSFQGEIGADLNFNWDEVSGRYYVQGEPAPTFDMTLTEEPKGMKPSRMFDEPEFNNEPMNNLPF